jgi:prepilin-type processing-associated H-X9-DG protein
MNELGVSILWCMGQVTAVGVLGWLLCVAARRIHSTAGSAIAVATLAIVVGLTCLAASPWPRWWDRAAREIPPPLVATTSAPVLAETEPGVAPSTSKGDWSESALDFWTAFEDELHHSPTVAPAPGAWRWPAIVAALFLTGGAVGSIRLLLGLRQIAWLRRRCVPIGDANLSELVQVLQAELGCRRPIELGESPDLGTAATVGWRRPVIILPAQWRQWTSQERRAVLAHEMAHIRNNDFLSSIVAQLGLVLHFYHPLMHWLTHRLRLEQELAADAEAARLAGGSRPYLTTLASLALRQDERRLAWSVRTFLPSRGTFLRRIEMLRDHHNTVARASTRRRMALVGLLVIAGILAAGLRAPDRRGGAMAQQPEPAAAGSAAGQQAATDPIDLKLVPSEACLVGAIRPARIFARPEMLKLAEVLNKQVEMEEALGLPVEQIDQVIFVALRPAPQIPGAPPMPPQPRGQILRATEPHDWAKYAGNLVPNAAEVRYAGQTYYRSTTQPNAPCYFRPDDRTIVIDEEASLFRYMLRAQGLPGEHVWAGNWDQVSGGVAAAAVDMSCIRLLLTDEMLRQPQSAPFAGFAPLWEESTSLVAGVTMNDTMQATIIAATPNEEGRVKVADTARALLTLMGNIAKSTRQQAAASPDGAAALPFFDLGMGLLATAKVDVDGSNVRAVASTDANVAQAAAILVPAVSAAREAARRAQAMNNLKQLALALHNYADVHKSFPPSVLYSPSNVPYSWRVAVLPYLEQSELYQQYNFDQPWDSPGNLKVLERMPVVLRDPGADPTSTSSSYFALTGPDAVFGDRTGTGFQQILDGTSNTLMLVEAQRDIPWTKPEDIAYDPNQPLPKFGGLRPNGFNAAFCDGSVRFISNTVAEAVLRALITKAGGEIVPQVQ